MIARAVLAVAVVLLAACGLPAETGGVSPSPHVAKSYDVAANNAREAAKPDPFWDFGQTVQITDQGFKPADLVSTCCQPVEFKNLTAAPVTVVFDHQLVNSGVIPPGGTFTWNPPNIESVVYHVLEHSDWIHGKIQVNQTIESMVGPLFTVA